MTLEKRGQRSPVEQKQQMRSGARISAVSAIAALPALIVGFLLGGLGLLVLAGLVVAVPAGYGAWLVYDAVYR